MALMKNQSMSATIKEQLFKNSILIGTSQSEEFQNVKMNLKSIEEKVNYVFNKLDKDHYFIKRWHTKALIEFYYMVKHLDGDGTYATLIKKRLKNPD